MFNWFKKSTPSTLPFHTDVHAHLVPGIDDGSRSVESSLALMERMERWGINRIIPTPHVTEDTFENTPSTIDPPYNALKEAAVKTVPGIELVAPTAEYRQDSFFLDSLAKGLVRPMPGNYLLVENGFLQEPWNLDNLIFDLKLKGFIPILAHPERYGYYEGKLSRYKQLHDSGLLFQCNVLSATEYYGKGVKKNFEMLLDNDLIDFLGTDIHNSRHADAIEAALSTSRFNKIASRLAGRLLNDSL